MNKFNLENCGNVKLNLNSFSLLRLISSEKSKYLAEEYKLQWFNCIKLDEYIYDMSGVWHLT